MAESEESARHGRSDRGPGSQSKERGVPRLPIEHPDVYSDADEHDRSRSRLGYVATLMPNCPKPGSQAGLLSL